MMYALQKYCHYLLRGHFKIYIDQYFLKYLVKKLVLGEHICIWLLLFEEYDFEVIVKLGHLNVGPDHLSWIENDAKPINIEEGLPDAQLYAVHVADGHFEDIIHFLTTRTTPLEYSIQQKKDWLYAQHILLLL